MFNTTACHSRLVHYFSTIQPIVIRIAEEVKISGHNLKGKKFILNPVNNETTAKTIKQMDDTIYMADDTALKGSSIVIATTETPINIRVTPSVIHSIVMIFLLSELMSPNPRTTDLVGIRCEMPQSIGSIAPT
jgi:hypothetical protein